MAEKRVKLGVLYALPQKYATSIRLRNLTERLEGVDVLEVRTERWPASSFGKLAVVLKNVLRVLNPRFSPDVIYASAPLLASSIPALAAKLFRRVPVVADWDDAFIDFSERSPRPWHVSFWEWLLVRKADHVVVVSDKLEEVALAMGREPEEVALVPNGVDLERFDPDRHAESAERLREELGLAATDEVVGFIGSINSEKEDFVGKDLVDCSVDLPDRCRFLIVGFGEGLERLKRYASERGVSDRFFFTGYVPHHEIPAYIALFDAAYLPLDDTKFTAQTRSSCKLKEYLAMGVPVVSVRVGEVARLLEKHDSHVLVDGTADLCHGLQRIIEKKKSENQEALRRTVREFAFADLSKRLQGVLGGIVK